MEKKRKRTSLSQGRPPTAQKPAPSTNHKNNRLLINKHHQLNKALAQARAKNDTSAIESLTTEINSLGGLEKYQQASIQGQSSIRGGDSSSILLEFLQPLKPTLASALRGERGSETQKARLLEIGALSTKNACARSGLFELTRIDLNAQAPGIEQQDFMERPLPTHKNDGSDKFDVISLSLVLNFVPEPAVRGEMLRRTCAFLDRRRWRKLMRASTSAPKSNGEDATMKDAPTENGSKKDDDDDQSNETKTTKEQKKARKAKKQQEKDSRSEKAEQTSQYTLLDSWLPLLFIVLPSPCVTNSRYCSEETLTLIMASLGFVLLRVRRTERMYYSLWQLRDKPNLKEQNFPKQQVNPGAGRNNFAVVLPKPTEYLSGD